MMSRTRFSNSLVRFLFLVSLALILPSCDEMPSEVEPRTPSKTINVGFDAVITGSYEGEVSGIGVLMFLPEAGFERRGYFFLSDDRGIRSYGVTFILPSGLALGKHKLKSPSSLDIGTVPSVRVDRDRGDSVVSADKNTSGILELFAFPDHERELSGSDVKGRFAFETDDKKGQKIAVNGKFSFKVK